MVAAHTALKGLAPKLKLSKKVITRYETRCCSLNLEHGEVESGTVLKQYISI